MHNANLTRRYFLISSSCVGAALAMGRSFVLPALGQQVATDKRVSETPLVEKGFASTRKVGDGVYATISDFSKGTQTISNGGFIVGRGAALVIEAHGSPAGAAYELDALRMVSKVPVKAAIDTHYHFDHAMGNSYFGSQSIPVWAHARTKPLMVERYAQIQGDDKSQMLAPLEANLEKAANETERQRAEGDLNAAKMIFQVVDTNSVSLPTRDLDPKELPMKVDLGGLTVSIETYPGHTDSDLIVRIPEQNITFTGDLLFNAFYPVTFDANMSAWRATTHKFVAFGKDALFVPGHGQVCGQEGVSTQLAVFDDVHRHAERMYKAGVTADEAQKRYQVPARFQNFPMFAWGITVATAIDRYYEEFKKRKA